MKTPPTTVGVNLLPRELVEHARARRVNQYTILGIVLFAAVLGGAYFLRLVEVGRAAEVREQASFQVTILETELSQLHEYRMLADQVANRSLLLAAVMDKDIAFSTLLNNLSLVFPAHASLDNFTVSAAAPGVPMQGQIDFGEAVATGEFSGYSMERFTPGVETVILDLDRTPDFFNAFVSSAAKADLHGTEVTTFAGMVSIDGGAYTGRYADGLPPEVAP